MTPSIFPSSLATIVKDQGSFPSWAASENNLQVLQNSSLLTPLAVSHIEALRAGRARTVFTGQQLGLFLGPAFTVYKIAAAIALAEALQVELKQAVAPIFWLQGDDHDFEEIRSTFFPDGETGTIRLEIPSDHLLEKVSVGRRTLPSGTAAALQTLFDATAADDEKQRLLKEAFREGQDLRTAFKILIQALFANTGLLIYDPLHPLAKAEAAAIFQTALTKAAEIEKHLEADTQRLKDSGQQEQVALRPGSPLFFVHFPDENGPRFRLLRKQQRFEAIGGDFQLSEDQLSEIIREQPSRISPSALLRPLLQDSLFPTIAYVGGDAERRYMLQISSLYPLFGKTQPFVVKRLGLFVLEPKVLRLLKDLSISIDEILQHPEDVERRVRGDLLSSLEFEEEIGASLELLLEKISLRTKGVSAEMSAAVTRNQDKLRRAVSGVIARYDLVLKTREDVQAVRFRKLSALLFPKGEAQERVITGSYYWLKYGDSYIEGILQEAKRWVQELESGPRCLTLGS